ncbi:hypothetical protein K440DRAFT_636363 [Wilcoxina mikolae CBS 423.85]|nr:hypothetical protein K440DRAFT_636363 [Wilcoxina mikolae CBS 423.85]
MVTSGMRDRLNLVPILATLLAAVRKLEEGESYEGWSLRAAIVLGLKIEVHQFEINLYENGDARRSPSSNREPVNSNRESGSRDPVSDDDNSDDDSDDEDDLGSPHVQCQDLYQTGLQSHQDTKYRKIRDKWTKKPQSGKYPFNPTNLWSTVKGTSLRQVQIDKVVKVLKAKLTLTDDDEEVTDKTLALILSIIKNARR